MVSSNKFLSTLSLVEAKRVLDWLAVRSRSAYAQARLEQEVNRMGCCCRQVVSLASGWLEPSYLGRLAALLRLGRGCLTWSSDLDRAWSGLVPLNWSRLLQRIGAWVWPVALALPLLTSPLFASADTLLPIGPEFQVNTYTNDFQYSPSVAVDADGDFVIAWTSRGHNGFGQQVDMQRYHASGVAEGGEFQITSPSYHHSPSAAMDADGDFVVAFEISPLAGVSFLHAQRYNASGIAQGSLFAVGPSTSGIQVFSQVVMDVDGDFVVVWENRHPIDDDSEVFARQYNLDGVAQGPEFRVNTYTTDRQILPSVAVDAGGDFVVAWASNGQDGSNGGVYAQRYNASGVAQGPEFRVNTYTTDHQTWPSVAADAGGNFVVAWNSNGQDGSNGGIYAQRYSANGMAQGSEFRVNTDTTGFQGFPDVAMDAEGDFLIVWASGSPPGSSRDHDIYAQWYNADGVAQASEFRVNTYTTDSQTFPSVAADADGDFVVAWTSYGQDGSNEGVYAQRYKVSKGVIYLPLLLKNQG